MGITLNKLDVVLTVSFLQSVREGGRVQGGGREAVNDRH